MTLRRPDKRAAQAYVAALKKYGTPPYAIWKRCSLRTRAAAIYLFSNGKNAPLDVLAETDEARRLPKKGDL